MLEVNYRVISASRLDRRQIALDRSIVVALRLNVIAISCVDRGFAIPRLTYLAIRASSSYSKPVELFTLHHSCRARIYKLFEITRICSPI